MLETMTVREATPRLLTLAVPQARAAMARAHLEEITRLVQQTGARGVSIAIVEVRPEPAEEGGSPGSGGSDGPGAGDAPSADVAGAEDHPLVREAARVFGAKVVHVEPKRPGSDAN